MATYIKALAFLLLSSTLWACAGPREASRADPNAADEVAEARTFEGLVEAHGMLALERQMAFVARLGGNDWQVDFDKGELRIGDRRFRSFQVLGTESKGAGSWLWGWANPTPDLQRYLKASEAVRAYGQTHGIAELTTREHPLDPKLSMKFALVGAGLRDATAWWFGGGDELTLLFLIDDPQEPSLPPPDGVAQQRVILAFISNISVDHKPSIRAYLRARGYQVATGASGWSATHASAPEIAVEWDAQGRLSNLKVRVDHAP